MEAFEALLKLVGLLLIYGLLFIFGVTIFVFIASVGLIYWVCSLFGEKENSKGITDEKSSREVYGHETTIIYKGEEHQALVIYYVDEWYTGPVIDIVSVASATEDFTDLLPAEEMSRLQVELEYSHVS